MKVEKLIKELLKFNQEADVTVTTDHRCKGFALEYDGRSKKKTTEVYLEIDIIENGFHK